MKVIRFFASFLLAPLAYSFAHEGYLFLTSDVDPRSLDWCIYGAIFYVLIYALVFRGKYSRKFYEHLKHESAHSMVGYIFLRRTRKLVVNPEATYAGEETSQVAYLNLSGPDFLVSLAPYYFPSFTIPLLIIRLFVSSPIHKVIDFLIGFTLAFHYISLKNEFGLKQDDIKEMGLMFSIVVTCILNIVFLIVIVCIVSDNCSSILNYFENSFVRALESYKIIYQTWRMRQT
jgi:hypothetical protein